MKKVLILLNALLNVSTRACLNLPVYKATRTLSIRLPFPTFARPLLYLILGKMDIQHCLALWVPLWQPEICDYAITPSLLCVYFCHFSPHRICKCQKATENRTADFGNYFPQDRRHKLVRIFILKCYIILVSVWNRKTVFSINLSFQLRGITCGATWTNEKQTTYAAGSTLPLYRFQ